MAQILAIANQKGGVGKTTTTANLGAALAEHGRRVLLIDSDPQASLTSAFGVDPGSLTHSLAHVLTEEYPLSTIIQSIQRIDLAPATIDLAAAELQLIIFHRTENMS